MYGTRRDVLREALPAEAAALLVTSATNVRYLTGFTGSNGALLLARDAVQDRLGTDFRYLTQSAEQSPDLEVVIARASVPELVSYAAEAGLGPLGFEAAHLSVAMYDALRAAHPDLPLVGTSGLVETQRTVKDPAELAALAEACRISDVALAQLVTEVRVGATEREVARGLDWLMLEHGAEAVSFDTIVAAGPNSAIPHHRPTDRLLAAGDLLKIDFGALYDGYHSDMTRTFVVGAPPADWQREIYALVAAAQRAGVERARGRAPTCATSTRRPARCIAAAGHGDHFGHGLGHGVGLEIHEAPVIGYAATGTLAAGTPVTVEPGVYLPGRGGVRIEDTLVVRRRRARARSPRRPRTCSSSAPEDVPTWSIPWPPRTTSRTAWSSTSTASSGPSSSSSTSSPARAARSCAPSSRTCSPARSSTRRSTPA